jgi:hypothetical protein
MPDQSNLYTPVDPAAAAAYIADLSTDLALIARRNGLDALGFILEMARLEAEAMCHSREGNRPDTASRT